ncbi:MAG TPA: hypothetical protein DDW30_03150 [Clostridiales bacterium]|nr:hypothetical protein [Clostridiales bacterium]
MRETNVLVIGTTALACGLALRLGADCTVADSGWSAGAEFADAMVAEPIDLTKTRAPRTAELTDELWERNILSRTGEVHCPALAGAFAKRFRAAGCRVLLGTRVLEIVRRENGFAVTLFLPREGRTELFAKRVINTLPQDFMTYRKTFSLMLADGIPSIGAEGSPRLRHGRFADESILTFDVPRDCTLPEAEKIANAWLTENRACLGNARVAGPALAFGYRFETVVDTERDGVRYVPSAAYPDAVSAFEGGETLCL